MSPSVKPSYSFPSAVPSTLPTKIPSRSPLPSSEILTTIIPYIAVETRQLGKNPLIQIQFTTIIKAPWALIKPDASGNAITGGMKWDTIKTGSCTEFSDLPGFMQSDALFCQTWMLEFEGDTHCNTDPRKLSVSFVALEPNGTEEEIEMSWDLDLGSSAAFECAVNLGTFQIALQIEGSSGGNTNFDSPGDAFLDDWYYFRVGASSGAPVTGVSISNLDIQSASGQLLCTDCQTNDELGIGISDWSPDNFIIHMFLDADMFTGHLTVSFIFTFEVKMSPTANSNRRRLQDAEQQVEQKVTLRLQPGTGKSDQTRPPTQANPDAPTPKPVEKVPGIGLPEVSAKLNSPEESSNLTSVWVALCVVSFMMLGGAYYYLKNSVALAGKEIKIEDVNPQNSAMSPSFSNQSAVFKEWSSEEVAAAIE